MRRLIERIRTWAQQLLVSIDQLLYVLIAGPIYIAFGGPCPSADETISSRVGRAALSGARWGIVAAWIIDRLFILLGTGPGHCRRNVETAFLGKAPTA